MNKAPGRRLGKDHADNEGITDRCSKNPNGPWHTSVRIGWPKSCVWCNQELVPPTAGRRGVKGHAERSLGLEG